MQRRRVSWLVTWLTLAAPLAGCAAAQERPEPPSGAVDPGTHGLATPGATAPTRAAQPADLPVGPVVGPSSMVGHQPAPAPVADAVAQSAQASTATGKMVMAREHCEALGRRFAELTLQQGGMLGPLGAGASGDGEAAGVGKTFRDGCVRDMVGQTVEVREYQCMLHAPSADALLTCKR